MNEIIQQIKAHARQAQIQPQFAKDQAWEIEQLAEALQARANERIEALTAALEKFDDLIQYQYTGSREAMSAMAEAAEEGARVLGRGAWKEVGQPWLWTYDAHLKEKKP